MAPTKITNKIFQAAPQVLHTQLDDETVLLEMKGGTYFKLNPVAAHLWNELASPRTLAHLQDSVVATFDVSSDEAARDVEQFLIELRSNELLLR